MLPAIRCEQEKRTAAWLPAADILYVTYPMPPSAAPAISAASAQKM